MTSDLEAAVMQDDHCDERDNDEAADGASDSCSSAK